MFKKLTASYSFRAMLLGISLAVFGCHAEEFTTVVDFASLSELHGSQVEDIQKRGCSFERVADGWKVFFPKYVEGSVLYPFVETMPGQLKVNDWTPFAYLVLEITNHSAEISPTIFTKITDAEGRQASARTRVRAGVTSQILLRLDSLGSVDLSRISKIGFTINKPQHDSELTLVSAKIGGSSKAIPDDALVSRVLDVKAEMAARPSALRMTGGVTLENSGKYLLATIPAYQPGLDKWPGITLQSRIGGALNNGDLSTKTHIVVSLESHLDNTNGGIRFRDDDEKEFWQSFALSKDNSSFELDRSFVDMGLDLKNIRYAQIDINSPVNTNAIKIKDFRFEFRPETLLKPAIEQLDALKNLSLTDSEQAEANSLSSQLNSLFDKVRGDVAQYGEIQKYISLVEKISVTASGILRNASLRDAEAAMDKKFPYAVGIADSMTSVFLEEKGFRMQPAKALKMELARREYESFQTVVFSRSQDLSNVNVSISYLLGPDNAILKSETFLVGHVKNERPSYKVEYVGWYPDFVATNRTVCTIKQGETVPFWTRIHATADTPPGIYKGQVTVSAEQVPSYSFPLEVRVFNFTIPMHAPIPQSWNFDHRPMSRIYNIAWGRDNQEVEDLMDQFTEQAAEYFITYDRLYWGPYGKYSKEKDRLIPRWKRLADKGQLTAFCICNPTPLGGHPSSPEDESVKKVIDNLKVFLDDRIPALREAGILDKAYIYAFDEWRVDAISDRVFGYVKENWPYLKIMTTAGFNHNPDHPGLKYIDALVPGILPARNPELTAELRKRGKEVWWYVCNFPRPPEPTFMLEVPAIVPRLFCGFMAQKYRPDGFLYWAVTAWRQWANAGKGAVVMDGPRSNWNPATCRTDNEEGNFFIPGENRIFYPTLRVENLRDGWEDLWYCKLLEKKLADSEVPEALQLEARRLLEIPDSLVRAPNDHTLIPEDVRARRREIAILLEKLEK